MSRTRFLTAVTLVAAAASTAACTDSIAITNNDERERLEVTGQVLSVDGPPIAGASIQPCDTSDFDLWCGQVDQTDNQGGFEIGETINPQVCPVELRIRADGFVDTEIDVPDCPGVDQTLTVTMEPVTN